MNTLKLSALDLATISKGSNTKEAIDRSVQSAQYIEQLGYERIWFAEHHNMEYIASSATSLLIGHVASQTHKIRVGSGGIMLPNHAPLVIAEQFGTLETLYPGRIDLGLGRAPGTDQLTAMALRRNNLNTSFYFKDDIQALQHYFENENPTEKVRAFPGEGLHVPLYILGSSTDSAYLAAELGLPYAFAAHFAPAMLGQAAEIYKANFKPSPYLDKPYFMVCVNIVAAQTTEEAAFLATSLFNLFAGIVTNLRRPLSPPTDQVIYHGIPEIEKAVQSMVSCTFVGDKEAIREQVSGFVAQYGVDEIITTNYIFDIDKKLESYRITYDALQGA
ncbi:LLM class flavin-dependent oxidoreductase [Sphingobacterium psychroaquaticum]|uniref:Luciferase-like monooxygenase n=1 Tax=Sphingobacterium psychroaquaticum TaxID=561061 RepID=A0A1X7JT27_9SPHI|nr:LLM class flavin-dependent oxidoreductase [Sphingobacterium psychroaquaticum]QBQ41123.1 LLM class flavin-dependent oxidoreductase [Sphingobacterium psychroaquaticum]SMG31248.1 luciferase family oxidoreductase, group 1 [Sphingobacterium psychroaquaticum]